MLSENYKNPDVKLELASAVAKLENSKYFEDIKVRLEGYEPPSRIKQKDSDRDYSPDITAVKNGDRVMIELAMNGADKEQLKSKWQLLTRFSKARQQELILLVPKGNLSFASEMLKDPLIEADIMRF